MDSRKILDVALFIERHSKNDTSERYERYPPLKKCISLSNDLWISPIDEDIADEIIKACTPHGYNFAPPILLNSTLYAFGRENPPNDDTWDSDERLQHCIRLSRLVHPTKIAFEFSARLKFDSDNKIVKIIPGHTQGFGAHAHISATERNWLTEDEAIDLRKVIKAFDTTEIKNDDLLRAFWYYEYACRLYELDIRSVLVVTSLESILNTSKTNQFVNSVQELVREIEEGEILKSDAEKIYEVRSKLVHGNRIDQNFDQWNKIYQQAEDILRKTLKYSLLNPSFVQLISEKKNLEKWKRKKKV